MADAPLLNAGDALGGQTIAAILGQSAAVVVYTTTDNHMRWDYRANERRVPSELAPAIALFDTLMAEISATLSSRHKPIAYAHLGKALFNALETGQADRIDHAFAGVRTFVSTCAMHAARFRYILAFLAAAGILALGTILPANLLTLAPDITQFLVAGACGIGGAVMSVLHRSRHLAVDPTAHVGFLALQGVARAILGVLFGAFIVLACKGELILGFAKDHPLALYPLAVVAGFSERFVPEVMSSLEHTP